MKKNIAYCLVMACATLGRPGTVTEYKLLNQYFKD